MRPYSVTQADARTTTIEQAREEWSYTQMRENYNANRNVWVEVSPTFCQQALEVMPPIYRRGGFMVGEAECDNAEGQTVYAGFATVAGRHFACYATPADFERAVPDLCRAVYATQTTTET